MGNSTFIFFCRFILTMKQTQTMSGKKEKVNRSVDQTMKKKVRMITRQTMKPSCLTDISVMKKFKKKKMLRTWLVPSGNIFQQFSLIFVSCCNILLQIVRTCLLSKTLNQKMLYSAHLSGFSSPLWSQLVSVRLMDIVVSASNSFVIMGCQQALKSKERLIKLLQFQNCTVQHNMKC